MSHELLTNNCRWFDSPIRESAFKICLQNNTSKIHFQFRGIQ